MADLYLKKHEENSNGEHQLYVSLDNDNKQLDLTVVSKGLQIDFSFDKLAAEQLKAQIDVIVKNL